MINLANFKRNTSLHKLGIIKLSGDEKRIYEILMNNLSNLSCSNAVNYPKYIFCSKLNQQLVFVYNSPCRWGYIDESIWKLFEKNRRLAYRDIDDLLTWWFEITLGISPKLYYDFNISERFEDIELPNKQM